MAIRKIKKVLIANRGEIALRIMRTVQELGLDAVVIYEKPDRNAYYVRLADDAIMIGEGPRKDYLDVDKVIWAAKKAVQMPFIQDTAFWLRMPIFQQDAKKRALSLLGRLPR
jgi:biotin carboxylase